MATSTSTPARPVLDPWEGRRQTGTGGGDVEELRVVLQLHRDAHDELLQGV